MQESQQLNNSMKELLKMNIDTPLLKSLLNSNSDTLTAKVKLNFYLPTLLNVLITNQDKLKNEINLSNIKFNQDLKKETNKILNILSKRNIGQKAATQYRKAKEGFKRGYQSMFRPREMNNPNELQPREGGKKTTKPKKTKTKTKSKSTKGKK